MWPAWREHTLNPTNAPHFADASKKRLEDRTPEEIASESAARTAKVVEEKAAREKQLAEEVSKLAPGRAGAGRVRIQSDVSLRASFSWADNSR